MTWTTLTCAFWLHKWLPTHKLGVYEILLGQGDKLASCGRMAEMFFQPGCEGGGLANTANLGITNLKPAQGQERLQGKVALQLALLADWKAYRERGKGQGSERYFGAWKASDGKPVEAVNEEPAINSVSHKALSRQKGILCGLRSPNKRRLEENRKGKKGHE